MAVRIIVGDALDRLAEIPDESVHCVVTSPPYFGLRDYKVPVTVWGGVPGCNHDWCDATVIDRRHLPEAAPSGKQSTNAGSNQRGIRPGDLCSCGAWRGSLGLEPTPDLFVAHLVDVFRQVRRVLRADGTLWLNIGDSYAGSWGAQGRRETEALELSWHGSQINNHPKRASNTGSIRSAGVKPKDLYGIPWLLAFALRADGWYLRQEVIWSKPNPMPESITDRCTKSHESLFLLTKSERYFYDQVAILEPASPNTHARLSQNVRAQIGSDRAHAGGKTNGRMKAVGRKMAPAGSGIKNNTSMDAALALMFVTSARYGRSTRRVTREHTSP